MIVRGYILTARALVIAATLLAVRPARAASDLDKEPRLSLRLAAGVAFDHEVWSPSGGSAGASYTGWAPALDAAVGLRVRPRLVIAGDFQLAPVVNRTESYRGGSYSLTDTIHFLDTLSAIGQYTFWRHPSLHVGGGIGLLVMTDVDTHMGSTSTNLGVALSFEGGYRRHLRGAWSIGVLGRLTFYRFGSDSPPPASSLGLLPAALVAFTR